MIYVLTWLAAIIIGYSSTSPLEYGESFSPQQNRTELLAAVVDEAQRLDRHIQNLLDMTVWARVA